MASTGNHMNAARDKIASAYANVLGAENVNAERMRLSFFRVGEGGVQTPGAGVLSPIDAPVPTLTNIQAPTKSVYFFEKALVPGVDVVVSGGLVTITVSVLAGEGESPNGVFPTPGTPTFSEVGIFDEAGTMVLYFTFPPEVKSTGVPWTKTFNIDFTP